MSKVVQGGSDDWGILMDAGSIEEISRTERKSSNSYVGMVLHVDGDRLKETWCHKKNEIVDRSDLGGTWIVGSWSGEEHIVDNGESLYHYVRENQIDLTKAKVKEIITHVYFVDESL